VAPQNHPGQAVSCGPADSGGDGHLCQCARWAQRGRSGEFPQAHGPAARRAHTVVAMSQWCLRCSQDNYGEIDLPHTACWDGHADEATTAAIVERAMSGSRHAAAMLGDLGDARAVATLMTAVSHPDLRVRASAIKGLGFSGTTDDVANVIPFLRDPDAAVREAAAATIAELGGQQAADALAGLLPQTRAGERLRVLESLAWLNDPRAAGPLRELIPEMNGQQPTGSYEGLPWALVRVGTPDDRQLLRTTVVDLARASAPDTDAALSWRAQVACAQYMNAVGPVASDEADETLKMIIAVNPKPAAPWRPRDSNGQGKGPSPGFREPVGDRVVARQAMAIGERSPAEVTEPPAKFGGQPDWREAPAWPLDASGRPLPFYGQLPLMGEPARTAYIFVSAEEAAPTWEPLGPGNAVVVQPGPAPHLLTAPITEGPQRYEHVVVEAPPFRRRRRLLPVVRYAQLADGADPRGWEWPDDDQHEGWLLDDPRDWNKIGGTPSSFKMRNPLRVEVGVSRSNSPPIPRDTSLETAPNVTAGSMRTAVARSAGNATRTSGQTPRMRLRTRLLRLRPMCRRPSPAAIGGDDIVQPQDSRRRRYELAEDRLKRVVAILPAHEQAGRVRVGHCVIDHAKPLGPRLGSRRRQVAVEAGSGPYQPLIESRGDQAARGEDVGTAWQHLLPQRFPVERPPAHRLGSHQHQVEARHPFEFERLRPRLAAANRN
jgi:hypothetical protein